MHKTFSYVEFWMGYACGKFREVFVVWGKYVSVFRAFNFVCTYLFITYIVNTKTYKLYEDIRYFFMKYKCIVRSGISLRHFTIVQPFHTCKYFLGLYPYVSL